MKQSLRTERHNDWFNSPPWRHNIPCPVSLDWFNKELLRIGGAEPNGTPHYRAVWGQDLEASMIRDRYENRFVPRYVHNIIRGYRISTASIITGLQSASHQERIIGIPRVYVEAFLPASVVCRAGTEAGFDTDGDHFSAWWPADGDWMTMLEINDHDEYKTCCSDASDKDRNCHGLFRPPDQRDVNIIGALWQAWQRMKSVRPGDAPDQDIASLAFKEAINRDRERQEAVLQEMSYHARNFFRTHLHDEYVDYGRLNVR